MPWSPCLSVGALVASTFTHANQQSLQTSALLRLISPSTTAQPCARASLTPTPLPFATWTRTPRSSPRRQIIFILDHAALQPDQVCTRLHYCTFPAIDETLTPPPSSWRSALLPLPPHPSQPPRTASTGDSSTFTVLQLTDIHYDHLYQAVRPCNL